MTYTVVFKLENSKYYIYETDDQSMTIKKLLQNTNIQWIKIHRPIKLINYIRNTIFRDGEYYMNIYAGKYGANNVRGPSFEDTIQDIDDIEDVEDVGNIIIRGSNYKFKKRNMDGSKYLSYLKWKKGLNM